MNIQNDNFLILNRICMQFFHLDFFEQFLSAEWQHICFSSYCFKYMRCQKGQAHKIYKFYIMSDRFFFLWIPYGQQELILL